MDEAQLIEGTRTMARIKKTELRIKIKTLAAEAKYIKFEQRKFPRGKREHEVFQSLHFHRVHLVRPAARSGLLAYGYLRGRSYEQLEQKCYEKPDWKEVQDLLVRFGRMSRMEAESRIVQWVDDRRNFFVAAPKPKRAPEEIPI
jgi:hypothetical protein